jgi:hypothetical protein
LGQGQNLCTIQSFGISEIEPMSINISPYRKNSIEINSQSDLIRQTLGKKAR